MVLEAVPLEFKRITLSPGAGAAKTTILDRAQNQAVLRIIGLQYEYTGTMRFAEFSTVLSPDAGGADFNFMSRDIGGTGPRGTWPSERDSGVPDFTWLGPYIDIQPGGKLVVDLAAVGLASDLQINLLFVELTKFIISRALLATDPETISTSLSGRLSLLNTKPTRGIQGPP